MIFLKPPASESMVNPTNPDISSMLGDEIPKSPWAQPVIGQELLDKTSAVEETSGFTANEKPAGHQHVWCLSHLKCQGFQLVFNPWRIPKIGS